MDKRSDSNLISPEAILLRVPVQNRLREFAIEFIWDWIGLVDSRFRKLYVTKYRKHITYDKYSPSKKPVTIMAPPHRRTRRKKSGKAKSKKSKSTPPASRKQYTVTQMMAAIDAVSNGMPVATAARTHGVPRITLLYKTTGKSPIQKNPGPSTVLTEEEESRMNAFIPHLSVLCQLLGSQQKGRQVGGLVASCPFRGAINKKQRQSHKLNLCCTGGTREVKPHIKLRINCG
ncbi:unnamed protein product, partial [Nesidiocoris tenuis]